MAHSPYGSLPPDAFWRTGVAERDPLDPRGLYRPKFKITKKTRIVTAGSCFAQHVGRALRAAGANVLDAEPLPAWVDEGLAQRFGYGLYSARYGNIYTAQQLDQLLGEAFGEVTPAEPVWPMGGAFVDAQRPSIEPEGLPDPETVLAHRQSHLAHVRQVVSEADLFVFTLGLTETWIHRDSGTVYPTAPGTIAGDFDPEVFAFTNAALPEVRSALVNVRRRLMGLNPKMKILLTVSPVPLTATASGQHVEVATSYSKAVLRAVAGMVSDHFANVDYFPSYEIITSPTARGVFYDPNLRNVTARGVQTAMETFLAAHGLKGGKKDQGRQPVPKAEDLMCEEALLEAFAQ